MKNPSKNTSNLGSIYVFKIHTKLVCFYADVDEIIVASLFRLGTFTVVIFLILLNLGPFLGLDFICFNSSRVNSLVPTSENTGLKSS